MFGPRPDLNLLTGPFWLNDRVLSFYFEYLHLHKFDSASAVCFISPEVSQFLKLAAFEEIPIFLEPLELEKKDVILLAVNNATDPSGKSQSVLIMLQIFWLSYRSLAITFLDRPFVC